MKNTFLNGNNLRKMNTQFKKFFSERNWNNPREIIVRVKSFEQKDIMEGRRNSVSSVVQVVDKVIQCDSAYWLTGTRWTPRLYVKASCYESHGFGSKTKVLFVFKNFKGKKDSISLFRTWNRKDFLEEFPCNLIDIEKSCDGKLSSKAYNIRRRYESFVKYVVKNELYNSMAELERGKISDELSILLQKFGCTPLEAVPYSHEFQMHGFNGCKQSKNGFKIALKQISTYCSLPSTLEVAFKKSKPKLLKLSKLGIEGSGYYDHSEGLQIRPEHLKQARKLQSDFKKISNGSK